VTNPRELYLHVAATAADLIAAPEVAAAWHEPSALPKMSVQSLAGHLAGQVFVIPQVLAEPVPAEEVIPIHAYYARVTLDRIGPRRRVQHRHPHRWRAGRHGRAGVLRALSRGERAPATISAL
jgi:hypothetical protein